MSTTISPLADGPIGAPPAPKSGEMPWQLQTDLPGDARAVIAGWAADTRAAP